MEYPVLNLLVAFWSMAGTLWLRTRNGTLPSTPLRANAITEIANQQVRRVAAENREPRSRLLAGPQPAVPIYMNWLYSPARARVARG